MDLLSGLAEVAALVWDRERMGSEPSTDREVKAPRLAKSRSTSKVASLASPSREDIPERPSSRASQGIPLSTNVEAHAGGGTSLPRSYSESSLGGGDPTSSPRRAAMIQRQSVANRLSKPTGSADSLPSSPDGKSRSRGPPGHRRQDSGGGVSLPPPLSSSVQLLQQTASGGPGTISGSTVVPVGLPALPRISVAGVMDQGQQVASTPPSDIQHRHDDAPQEEEGEGRGGHPVAPVPLVHPAVAELQALATRPSSPSVLSGGRFTPPITAEQAFAAAAAAATSSPLLPMSASSGGLSALHLGGGGGAGGMGSGGGLSDFSLLAGDLSADQQQQQQAIMMLSGGSAFPSIGEAEAGGLGVLSSPTSLDIDILSGDGGLNLGSEGGDGGGLLRSPPGIGGGEHAQPGLSGQMLLQQLMLPGRGSVGAGPSAGSGMLDLGLDLSVGSGGDDYQKPLRQQRQARPPAEPSSMPAVSHGFKYIVQVWHQCSRQPHWGGGGRGHLRGFLRLPGSCS